MPCKHYKDALIEAAASGLNPQGELRAHLAACPACRTAFAEEQSLFSSIDTRLHAAANSKVPASLLPRVRAQLNSPSDSRKAWLPAWAVLAATAALVFAMLSVRGRRDDASGQNPQGSTRVQAVLPAEIPTAPIGALSPANPGQRMIKRILPSKVQAAASVEQVSVLLPAGQKLVIDAWLEGLRRGKLKGNELLAQKADLPLQDLQISPLDVSPIEMKPLADVSGESPSQSGEAKL